MAAVTAAMVVALVLSACGADTSSWVKADPADGWPAQYADAANSSFTTVAGAEALGLDWTRSVKGDLAAQVALGSGNYLAVNAQTPGGCSLMVWEVDNEGRQRWCGRLWPGGGLSGPLFDGFDNLYVGQPGAMLSYPPTQWIRWRQPVIGLPLTPRIVAPGHLLVTTHLGQMLVFDAHRGVVIGTPVDLVDGLDPKDSQRGLDDCQPARSRCPIAAAPAFSPETQMVVLGLWEPGADAPVLVGMRYRDGEKPQLNREWTSTAVGGGPLSSPVLSADGQTVYVNGRDNRLWALDSANGEARWSVDLGYQPQTPPSVTPDGLIVAGGGPDARLTGVRGGEVVWTRDDVETLSTSSRAGTDVAYTVSRDGENGMALLVFDPADGATINTYALPQATGYPVGVSVGHDRRVLTATSDGQVYAFAPA
jgi:outer membrane protein assembly factor BamB